MKNQKIVLTIALGALSLFSCEVYAQQRSESGNENAMQIDSAEMATDEAARTQKIKDANTIADYKDDRKDTKAKAREARRVEKEANTAARESRYALRSEKRAQKARKDADKQAERASRARVKSDRN
ncbi:MAG: hypothetical protein M3Y60_07810 [Bacteroidota bacterium]|nr:hypothetical protein [Bacteroidota bacterium]